MKWEKDRRFKEKYEEKCQKRRKRRIVREKIERGYTQGNGERNSLYKRTWKWE